MADETDLAFKQELAPDVWTGKQYQTPPTTVRPDQRKYLRGALVSIDPKTKEKKTIPFQYNPEELSRSLQPREYTADEGTKGYVGAASQTIDLTVQLQAVDTMIAKTKEGKKDIAAHGLYAHLAALELLLYAKSEDIENYKQNLTKGKKGVVPAVAGPVLFVWGPQRVLPVQLKSFSVTEKLFNAALSPVTAQVKLQMEVDNIIDSDGDAYQLLLTHLKNLEKMVEQQSGEVYGSQTVTGAEY